MTRDSLRIAIAATMLLWLGLMFASPLLADEGWQELAHPSLDALFASSGQRVTPYAAARLDAVSVWFPDDDMRAARHAEKLRRLTSDFFEAAIAARGMTVTANGDAGNVDDVVVVRVQLIDLRSLPGDSVLPEWADHFRFRVAAGRVTLVAELVDAATGQAVLRMADLQDSLFVDSPATVNRMLQQWGDTVAQHAVTLPASPKLARAH